MIMHIMQKQLLLKKENINLNKIYFDRFSFHQVNLILILENILKKIKFIQNGLIKGKSFYSFKEIGIISIFLLIVLCKFLNELLKRSPLVYPTIDEDSELEQCLSKKRLLQDEIKMLKQFSISGDKYVSFTA